MTVESCLSRDRPRRLRRSWPTLCSTVLTLALLAGAIPHARAHAIVIASSPRQNAVVAPGATVLQLDYNSRIDRPRSRATLQRPDGSSVALSWLDGGSPTALRANAELDAEGPYVVRWEVLSDDGHVTHGTVAFRVAAPRAQR